MATNTGSPAERLEALANTLRAEAHGRRQHHDSDGWRVLNEAAETVNSIAQQVAQQAQPEEMRKRGLALAAVGIGLNTIQQGGYYYAVPINAAQVNAMGGARYKGHATPIDALAAAAEALGLQPVPLQQSEQVPVVRVEMTDELRRLLEVMRITPTDEQVMMPRWAVEYFRCDFYSGNLEVRLDEAYATALAPTEEASAK